MLTGHSQNDLLCNGRLAEGGLKESPSIKVGSVSIAALPIDTHANSYPKPHALDELKSYFGKYFKVNHKLKSYQHL